MKWSNFSADRMWPATMSASNIYCEIDMLCIACKSWERVISSLIFKNSLYSLLFVCYVVISFIYCSCCILGTSWKHHIFLMFHFSPHGILFVLFFFSPDTLFCFYFEGANPAACCMVGAACVQPDAPPCCCWVWAHGEALGCPCAIGAEWSSVPRVRRCPL